MIGTALEGIKGERKGRMKTSSSGGQLISYKNYRGEIRRAALEGERPTMVC